jgi:hypothetical protein
MGEVMDNVGQEKVDRGYALDPERLDGAIEVLKRAAESSRLTRHERLAHRVLSLSSYLSSGALILFIIALPLRLFLPATALTKWSGVLFDVPALLLVLAAVVGVLSLVLSLPLFLKSIRDRAKLKRLGLVTLSKSLWKAGRRHRWLQRIRGGLLRFLGSLALLMAAVAFLLAKVLEKDQRIVFVPLALCCVVLSGTMLSARYLRRQREQGEFFASPEKLQEALRELRRHAGDRAAVLVPAEMLERVARIESARIAQEQTAAILASAGSVQGGYAVIFAPEAAQQRSALDTTERLELEELVEQLSTETLRVEPDAGAAGGVKRARTASSFVQVEYATDEARRAIRVMAVRRFGDEAHRAPRAEEHGHD